MTLGLSNGHTEVSQVKEVAVTQVIASSKRRRQHRKIQEQSAVLVVEPQEILMRAAEEGLGAGGWRGGGRRWGL